MGPACVGYFFNQSLWAAVGSLLSCTLWHGHDVLVQPHNRWAHGTFLSCGRHAATCAVIYMGLVSLQTGLAISEHGS